MTPKDLKNARRTLGLSVKDFCAAFGVANERTVRGWELGYRGDQPTSIPKPVELLVGLSLEFSNVREWLSNKAGLDSNYQSEYDE